MAYPSTVTLDDIRSAAARLAGQIERTPCSRSRTLSAITGATLWLKFENLQFTASFKERGAYNKLASLTPEERRRGVIAMSAGNHAQGVAYHARRLGIPATIVMPRNTPRPRDQHADHRAPGPPRAKRSSRSGWGSSKPTRSPRNSRRSSPPAR